MTYENHDFARDLADQMTRERFGDLYGVESFADYLDHVDARQTQHLTGAAAANTLRASGNQRRKIKLTVENAATVAARVPMKDSRRPGALVWAEIELAALLDLIENGADGAWFLDYAGSGKAYVKTYVPLASAGNVCNVTLGRLVAGAGKGRMVRFRDRNPLNLRRSNVFIVGKPTTAEGPMQGAKHDARAVTAKGAALRQSFAGSDFDIPTAAEREEQR